MKHGVFIDVLYVPSLSAKQLLFGPNSVEITNISSGEIVAKGIADHDSKS